MLKRLVWVLLLVAAIGTAHARDKIDKIYLRNGDALTCEIKSLSRSKLSVGTDAMGTVSIEWDEVARIESEYFFEIELSNGRRLFGSLGAGEEPGNVRITAESGVVDLASQRIVGISQLDELPLLERLDGSFSVGYNFTKASDVSTFSMSGSIKSRTRERSSTINAQYIRTDDASSDDSISENVDFNGAFTREFKQRWFYSGLAGFERNDELGLDYRLSLGGGIGRHLIQDSVSELQALAGLVVTHESQTGDSRESESIEALLGASYSRYIYDDPELNLDIKFAAYPSLTQSGRYRSSLDTQLRYELVSDLFLDFTIYADFDSEPATDAQSSSDYGVVTSIGYSF